MANSNNKKITQRSGVTPDLKKKRSPKRVRQKKKGLYLSSVVILVLIILGLLGRIRSGELETLLRSFTGNATSMANSQLDESSAMVKVHFLDVGQADCTLIQAGGEFMLVDAGNNDDGELIVKYLQDQGVETLKYVIGTHPHEDHIGSLDTVIKTFSVENVIMPAKTHTTKTFEDVLTALEEKDLSITVPEPGMQYSLGTTAFTVLAPNRDYQDNLNNWSVGIRLVNGNTQFILCGDAETAAEKDILANGLPLSATVLKVSHHGSNTSSGQEFLTAISPSYVVISVGQDNSYGHPHQEVMERLKAMNVELYRTDQNGTVTIVSDGQQIRIETEK